MWEKYTHWIFKCDTLEKIRTCHWFKGVVHSECVKNSLSSKSLSSTTPVTSSDLCRNCRKGNYFTLSVAWVLETVTATWFNTAGVLTPKYLHISQGSLVWACMTATWRSYLHPPGSGLSQVVSDAPAQKQRGVRVEEGLGDGGGGHSPDCHRSCMNASCCSFIVNGLFFPPHFGICGCCNHPLCVKM